MNPWLLLALGGAVLLGIFGVGATASSPTTPAGRSPWRRPAMPSARARWSDFIPEGEEVEDHVARNLVEAGRSVVDPLALSAARSLPPRPAPTPVPVAGLGPPALHPKLLERDPDLMEKLKDGRAIVMRFPGAFMQAVAAAALAEPTATQDRLSREFRGAGAVFDVAYYMPVADAGFMVFVVDSDGRPQRRVIVVS